MHSGVLGGWFLRRDLVGHVQIPQKLDRWIARKCVRNVRRQILIWNSMQWQTGAVDRILLVSRKYLDNLHLGI